MSILSQFSAGLAIAGILTGTSAFAIPLESVDYYGVHYRSLYSQNSANAPTASVNTAFYIEVFGSNIQTGTFSGPGGQTNEGLFVAPNGTNATRTYSYPDPNVRDSNHPLGDYTINIGSSSATVSLTSDVYSNTPMITGGTWANDRLQVTESGYTFNFNTPVSADVVRLRIYQQGGGFDAFYYEGNGTTNSLSVSGDDLVLGLNYGASLDFINYTDVDTLAGTNGGAGYMVRNGFQLFVVDAVPETSNYTLLGGLISLGVVLLRRRERA